jgi:hypothetical protein
MTGQITTGRGPVELEKSAKAMSCVDSAFSTRRPASDKFLAKL